MKIKESVSNVVLVFLGITILGCTLLVALSMGVWRVLGLLNQPVELMATIEAISTAVAAGAVFGAGYIAYRELSEVANTRYMDIADRLFGELNSPENVAARRRIFQNIKDNPEVGLRNLSQEDQDAMKMVLNSLDRVSFLTQSGWIPDELVMPWMHPMIAKSWEKLEPYVLYERKRRNEPFYYRYAGRLAERCNQWRAQNLNAEECKTKWVDNAL